MMKSNQNYYSRILIRTGIVGVCCLIMFSFSSQQVHEFKYRNYPAYLEAEKQFHAEPDNQELLNKYEEERRKMEQGQ